MISKSSAADPCVGGNGITANSHPMKERRTDNGWISIRYPSMKGNKKPREISPFATMFSKDLSCSHDKMHRPASWKMINWACGFMHYKQYHRHYVKTHHLDIDLFGEFMAYSGFPLAVAIGEENKQEHRVRHRRSTDRKQKKS